MQPKYKAAIFDFDGTIVDSFPGIARSVRHALKETLGMEIEDLEPLKKFVGPPLHDSFRNMDGMDESGAEHAVQCFRDRYSRKGYRECELYDGILDMLKTLRENGIDFIGALYAGYGPRVEFEDFPYVLLTDSPEEIRDYILKTDN